MGRQNQRSTARRGHSILTGTECGLELVSVYWLDQMLVEASPANVLTCRLGTVASQRDYACRHEVRQRPQVPGNRIAIHLRKPDVEQDDVRAVARAPSRCPICRRARSSPRGPSREGAA